MSLGGCRHSVRSEGWLLSSDRPAQWTWRCGRGEPLPGGAEVVPVNPKCRGLLSREGVCRPRFSGEALGTQLCPASASPLGMDRDRHLSDSARAFWMLSAIRSFQKHPPSHGHTWACTLPSNLCSCSGPSSHRSVAAPVPTVTPDIPASPPAGYQQSREREHSAGRAFPAPGAGGRAAPSFAVRMPREKVEKILQGGQSSQGSSGAGVRSKERARVERVTLLRALGLC